MRKITTTVLMLSIWATVMLFGVMPLGANELKIGLLYHDIAPVWGNTKIERGVDLNAEFIFGAGLVKTNAGVSLSSSGETSRVYAGFVVGRNLCGISCSLGFGLATVVNYERALGSTVLFRVAGEIGLTLTKDGQHTLSLILDHISNANLAEHNAGLDLLGVRYGIRF